MDPINSGVANTNTRPLRAERKLWHRFDGGQWILRLGTIFVYLFLYLPIVVIVVMSFHPDQFLTFPLPGFSLRWYFEFADDDLMIRALLNSLGLGFVTAIVSALVGTPCAIGLVRLNFPGKRFFNAFVMAPMIIPQIITGTSLLIFLNALSLPSGWLYLVIGHVLLTLPYIVITVSSQLYGFPKNLEEASLNLGANELETFFEVTLPLIRPSIIAGMLFAFTISFQEFVASQAWATPSTYTLPIRIFGRIRDALTPEVNVVGVLMVALSFAVVAVVELIIRRNRGGNQYGI
ncbi:MAG: ABC transporter permease [Chloroflexota bacterium]